MGIVLDNVAASHNDPGLESHPLKIDRFLLIRACVFALLLSFPQFIAYVNSNGYSQDAFHDSDEAFYFRGALDLGNSTSKHAVYFEHDQRHDLFSLFSHSRPDQGIVPYLIGSIGHHLGLRGIEVGLLLDLILPPMAYIAFVLFFSTICTHRFTAELSALFLLVFPWTLSINNFIHFDLTDFLPLGSPAFMSHSTLPVLEGISSQVSYPIFGMSLFFFLRLFRSNTSIVDWILAGGFSGLLLYCYFFCWLSFLSIVGIFVCLTTIVHPSEPFSLRKKRRLSQVISFGLSHLVVVLPGIAQIAAVGQAENSVYLAHKNLLGSIWYFSLEWFLCLVVLFIVYKLGNPKRHTRTLLGLGISCIVSEFMLFNIQPLIGFPLNPIYFSVMYLHPLFSGVIFCLVLDTLFKRKSFRKICLAGSVVLVLCVPLRMHRLAIAHFENDTELAELAEYVDTQISSDSVFAMLTFEYPFTAESKEWHQRWKPNALASLTSHYLLKEAWGLEAMGWEDFLSHEESLKRELALGVLFFGSPRLIRSCPERVEILDTTMFFQQWINSQLHRMHSCEVTERALSDYSSCEVVNDFRIDYVVWEPTFNLEQPDWFSLVTELVWESSNEKYQLFRFNAELARSHFC